MRMPLAALLALGAVHSAAALTFEEAAAKLASEEFAEREAGEKFLSMLGMEHLPRLEALSKGPDPEVAFRSRRALLCVRLGLGLSPEVAKKIADLRGMNPRQISAAIDQLLATDSLGLIPLAGLHTEMLTNVPAYAHLHSESRQNLCAALSATAALQTQPIDISQIHPQNYHAETLGLLAAGFSQRHRHNLSPILPVYSAWLATRPELRALLPDSAIPLELARIQANFPGPLLQPGDAKKHIAQLLALANLFPLPSPQHKAVLAGITEVLPSSPHFPIESLELDQGITLLAALQDNWNPQLDITLYERFRQRFPHAVPAKNTTLEVTYLIEKEGVNAALALALQQDNTHAAFWLGTWLQANPEKIPNPLKIPAFVKEERRQEVLRPFINALVPLRTLAEMEANPKAMAACQTLLADDEWLEAALKANVALPFFFHWIRQGTLDTAISKHLAGSTDRLRALGRLLVTKPESMASINPAHQSPLDLQRILLGMLEQPLQRPVAKLVFAQADEWLKLYPDMLRTNAFRFDIPRAESLSANGSEILKNLLSLAPKYSAAFAKDDPAYLALLRSLNRFSLEAQTFPTTSLTAEEGYLFFSTFAATPATEKIFAERYEAFRMRHSKARSEPH